MYDDCIPLQVCLLVYNEKCIRADKFLVKWKLVVAVNTKCNIIVNRIF